jgi:hypothetical protein
MHLILPVLFRLLPLAIPLLSVGMAQAINAALSCTSIGKRAESCVALDSNVGPVLGAMFWWGALLWIPGMLFSAVLLSRFLRDHLPAPWGKARKQSMR